MKYYINPKSVGEFICGYTIVDLSDETKDAFQWVSGDRNGNIFSTEVEAEEDAIEDNRITTNEYYNY